MDREQKDAICELWIEIFGTQEGAGYNCPAGAYDFAEVVMEFARQEEHKKFCSLLAQLHDSFSLQSSPLGLKKRA